MITGLVGGHATLAAALNGSIQRDVYYARARNFKTSLEAALFPDQVPVSVYERVSRGRLAKNMNEFQAAAARGCK